MLNDKMLIWFLFLIGVLAHSTLLWKHFEWMWKAEHFQFFPIALLAAGVLLYSKRREFVEIVRDSHSGPPAPSTLIVSILLSINVMVFSFALLAEFPLLGWLSTLLFLAVIVYASYGWLGLKVACPVFVVLLVIRPIPGGLEQILTTSMQRFASNISSHLLDAMGVIHYRQGVVLVLPTQSFMAEEACSGIRSLFSSITAIVFWGLLHRYHWARHLVNVIQTILWVVVFNALRITLVVWVEDVTEYSLATGLTHDFLGLIVFFCIFGTVLSADQLMASLARSKKDEEEMELNPPTPIQWSIASWLHWRATHSAVSFWIVVFGLLLIGTFRLQANKGFLGMDSATAEQYLGVPTADFMPPSVGEWTQVSFEHLHRHEHADMGSDSYVWKFANSEHELILSIDGSFNEYHDLSFCYANLGWSVSTDLQYDTLADRIAGQRRDKPDWSKLELRKPTGETGIVLFSAVDRNGSTVYPSNRPFDDTPVRIVQSMSAIFGLQSDSGFLAMNYRRP
ncbi:MAG: exosortase U, partial [Pirellula sp.]